MVSLIRRLLRSVADIAVTRLEWVALEIEAERLRLARLWVSAALTLFLLFTGTWLGVAGLLLWAEPAQRAPVAGVLALMFLAAGAVAAFSWRRLSRQRLAFRWAPPGPSSP